MDFSSSSNLAAIRSYSDLIFSYCLEVCSKSSVAIANSTAKMQENAMKALNAVKPKDSTGVIIMASIGCVVVIGIIITIIFALQ